MRFFVYIWLINFLILTYASVVILMLISINKTTSILIFYWLSIVLWLVWFLFFCSSSFPFFLAENLYLYLISIPNFTLWVKNSNLMNIFQIVFLIVFILLFFLLRLIFSFLLCLIYVFNWVTWLILLFICDQRIIVKSFFWFNYMVGFA